VLVTHQLQFASRADRVVLLEGGTVREQGTYAELMAMEGGAFKALVTKHVGTDARGGGAAGAKDGEGGAGEAEAGVGGKGGAAGGETGADAAAAAANGEPAPTAAAAAAAKAGGKLVQKEEQNSGRIDRQVYRAYARSMGGSCNSALLVFCFVFSWLVQLGSDVTIAMWTDPENPLGFGTAGYLGLYVACGLGATLTTLLRGYVFTRGAVRASAKLHKSMLSTIVRSPSGVWACVWVGACGGGWGGGGTEERSQRRRRRK
jgi:hypothetical protein